jgi:hypothetical protein
VIYRVSEGFIVQEASVFESVDDLTDTAIFSIKRKPSETSLPVSRAANDECPAE